MIITQIQFYYYTNTILLFKRYDGLIAQTLTSSASAEIVQQAPQRVQCRVTQCKRVQYTVGKMSHTQCNGALQKISHSSATVERCHIEAPWSDAQSERTNTLHLSHTHTHTHAAVLINCQLLLCYCVIVSHCQHSCVTRKDSSRLNCFPT